MTEMAAEARCTIADQGGLTKCDIGTINRRLRRTHPQPRRLRHSDRARRSETRHTLLNAPNPSASGRHDRQRSDRLYNPERPSTRPRIAVYAISWFGKPRGVRRIVSRMNDDPLLGCRLKLQGARWHRQALGEELKEFLTRAEPESSPLHLGVIVGDFLHNLRCVLDQLVWQLVVLNGGKPGDHNQFPIFDTPDAYKKKAGRYLRGVAADHRALIETFQPYHVGVEARYHNLAVLRDLSNIDKHRFVHPVVIVGEGDTSEVRFTELEVTTNALFRLEHYITHTLFERFERLFPLPAHAVDNVITNAVHDAVAASMDLSGRRPEAALVRAIADADSLRRRRASIAREARYQKLPGWTRQPGGVDLALDGVAAGRVLIEMKVDKPQEALWDALKLCDILSVEDRATAYLIYAGTARTWREEVEGADLFLTGGVWRALDLINRWPSVWASLLEGGRGIRPRRGVGAIAITPVSWIGMHDTPEHSVQIARVAPVIDAPPQEYDNDGWPIGFTPPRSLRSRVRSTLARQQATQRVAAPQTDRCHGYPWYPRWTDRRLAEVVPGIGHTDAFDCLRQRLATERGWTESELRSRLDPLRSPLP